MAPPKKKGRQIVGAPAGRKPRPTSGPPPISPPTLCKRPRTAATRTPSETLFLASVPGSPNRGVPVRCAAGVLGGISAGRRTAVTNRPLGWLGEKGLGMGSPQIQRGVRGTPTLCVLHCPFRAPHWGPAPHSEIFDPSTPPLRSWNICVAFSERSVHPVNMSDNIHLQ